MIVVLVTFEVAPEDRESFVVARHDQVRRSLAEPGNLEYALSYDAADDRLVRLTERWESREVFDAHIAAINEQGPIADGPALVSRTITVFDAQPMA